MIHTHVHRMYGGAVRIPLDAFSSVETPQSSRWRTSAISLKHPSNTTRAAVRMPACVPASLGASLMQPAYAPTASKLPKRR
jgi:hypothetical protein